MQAHGVVATARAEDRDVIPSALRVLLSPGPVIANGAARSFRVHGNAHRPRHQRRRRPPQRDRPWLAHLEHRLAELDQLRHDLVQDAHALADAVQSIGSVVPPRSVFSIRDAAAELGVSVSMLHKLIKERRLGHLKVGARTLITAEHLAAFRQASEVSETDVRLTTTRHPA